MKAYFWGAVAAAALLLGCSAGPTNSDRDGGVDDGGEEGPTDPWPTSDAEAGPECVNLACQQVACGGGSTTTVSGTMWDPGGRLPVYNVYVYVPNAAVEAMPIGSPKCTQCQAPASGKPLVWASTDTKGKFTVSNMPVGFNIPLVMQLGKFRRQIIIPEVKACQDNLLADANLTRLPKNSKEGDIPLIAFTTGCDEAECFLKRTIGLDPSEFGGPSDTAKHVHLYRGQDDAQPLPGTPGDAYALWGDLAKMKKYDIIFDACECAPLKRDTMGPAYTNVKSYLESGGRMFTTHYFYNFFASSSQCTSYDACGGWPESASVADWMQGVYTSSTQFKIDTTFPKGKAMADWHDGLWSLKKPPDPPKPLYGEVALFDTRNDVGKVNKPKGTNWIYQGDVKAQYESFYLSFNVPVNTTEEKQCGRAVFSDVHLSGSLSYGGGAWPTWCDSNPTDAHKANENALEFLFFDLSSCVQDDSKPVITPPPN